jgi:glycosyltransferase involved in cell wall biosynthesis
MKRILHIPNFYLPHTGGIEDVCYNTVVYMAGKPDVEQHVFCFSGGKQSVSECYEGIDVTRVGAWAKLAGQSLAPRYYDKLERAMRRFRPHIVHFHAPNPLPAACLLMLLDRRTKLIVHWHSDIVAQRRIYRFIKSVETALLRRADVVVATSRRYIDGSEPLRPFTDKCVVIPNVVNTSKLVRVDALVDEIRSRYDDKPLLLFVGRHVPYKGLDHLLAAVGMVEGECEVVVGGSGPLTERLKREYPLKNVHFAGRIPDHELSAHYHAADIFIFPSVTKNEAFGVALAEAMWCETPAVTFTIPGSGVNWVNIDGETGIEVDNADEEQLARAIDRLLSHEYLRKEYGRNAHRRVEELMTMDKIAHLFDEIYA